MELPSALKKSPMEPAFAGDVAMKAPIVKVIKIFFRVTLILSRRQVWRRSELRQSFAEKQATNSLCLSDYFSDDIEVVLPNLFSERKSIRCRVPPSRARSAAISPMTGANLKPCPEKPPQRITFA